MGHRLEIGLKKNFGQTKEKIAEVSLQYSNTKQKFNSRFTRLHLLYIYFYYVYNICLIYKIKINKN